MNWICHGDLGTAFYFGFKKPPLLLSKKLKLISSSALHHFLIFYVLPDKIFSKTNTSKNENKIPAKTSKGV